MRTSPPNRIHRFGLAAVIVVAALGALHASALAQGGAASGAEARDPKPGSAKPGSAKPGSAKPGSAKPGPPKQDPAPGFVPSEAVSSGKPVSFPTDI